MKVGMSRYEVWFAIRTQGDAGASRSRPSTTRRTPAIDSMTRPHPRPTAWVTRPRTGSNTSAAQAATKSRPVSTTARIAKERARKTFIAERPPPRGLEQPDDLAVRVDVDVLEARACCRAPASSSSRRRAGRGSPAPAERRTWRTGRRKPVGRPFLSGSAVSERCVFAMQMGSAAVAEPLVGRDVGVRLVGVVDAVGAVHALRDRLDLVLDRRVERVEELELPAALLARRVDRPAPARGPPRRPSRRPPTPRRRRPRRRARAS